MKQLTVNLWKTRVANVNTRKSLESDIDITNYNIAQNLRSLIKPISSKLKDISIELVINDSDIDIQFERLLKFKKKILKLLVTYKAEYPLKKVLLDEKNLCLFLKEIEILARLLKKNLTPDLMSTNVTYNTRTKYF